MNDGDGDIREVSGEWVSSIDIESSNNSGLAVDDDGIEKLSSNTGRLKVLHSCVKDFGCKEDPEISFALPLSLRLGTLRLFSIIPLFTALEARDFPVVNFSAFVDLELLFLLFITRPRVRERSCAF